MTKFEAVNRSYENSDCFVFLIGGDVYICFGECSKHRKEATVEFNDCSKAHITNDEKDIESYDGDVEPGAFNIILDDPFPDKDCLFSSVYHIDEIVSIIRIGRE